MHSHHKDALDSVMSEFESDPTVLSLLLTGSIAHGTASKTSDIDLAVIVDEPEYRRRKESGELTLWKDLSDHYEGGYVDAKFVTTGFLEEVASKGSEPARYAFLDAQVLFDKTQKVSTLIEAATRYPVEKKEENLERFYAQLEAWNWYCHEAVKHGNVYLLNHSISNLILFGGRIVLAVNETLYPYHKWFLHVLAETPAKPELLMKHIDSLLNNRGEKEVEAFYECIKSMPVEIRLAENWSHQFVLDSELNWLGGDTPVADL